VRDAAGGRADPHEERYDAGMVRHRRIALATTAALAGLLSAAFAPAAGDQRVSGASSHAITYNEDGVPMVRSGPECRAGAAGYRAHHDKPDPADF
jgi:hypothetical protein